MTNYTLANYTSRANCVNFPANSLNSSCVWRIRRNQCQVTRKVSLRDHLAVI